MSRTQWIELFGTTIANHPAKPGVWRRKDGGFVIRARVRDPRTGKDREIRRILPGESLEAAVAQLAEEKARIASGEPSPPAVVKVRLRDHAQALLAKKIQTGAIRSAENRAKWRLTLQNHIGPRLGDLYMSEIRRSDLTEYHAALASSITAGRYAPQTCESIFRIVKVVVRAYAREFAAPDIASRLPGFDHSLRRTYTRQQPNSLRPDETKTFLSAVAEKYPEQLTMVCLGFAVGLRPSSLRALYKVDVLFEDGGWLLNRRSHTIGQEIMQRTKIGKDAEIPLSPNLVELLRCHLESLPPGPMRDSPLLFPSATGGVLDNHKLWRIFRHIERSLQMPKQITPRGMRRTSKDLLRLSGVSQVVAMAINGHHTDEMHNHYSTVNEVEIRAALSRATELGGVPKGVQIGVKTGVSAGRAASKNPRQRRERCKARIILQTPARLRYLNRMRGAGLVDNHGSSSPSPACGRGLG